MHVLNSKFYRNVVNEILGSCMNKYNFALNSPLVHVRPKKEN